MNAVKEKAEVRKAITEQSGDALRLAFIYGFMSELEWPEKDLQRAADNTVDIASMIEGLTDFEKKFVLMVSHCIADESYIDRVREKLGLPAIS